MSLKNYLKETRGELKHVNWPNRQQTINLTVLVIILSFVVGGLLGLFDVVFTKGLAGLIS